MRNLKYLISIAAAAIIAVASCFEASAQFKEDAFSQQYNDDKASDADTTDTMFSFKEYFSGLAHKEELKVGTVLAGSSVCIGGMQIYNRQYWKLPISYGLIGGGVGAGLYFTNKGDSKAATWSYIGAGVAYWGTLLDGVINYRPNDYPHAGTATLFSLLVPGLGQIYNREYWKVPIYLGLMGFGVHYYTDCAQNYNRFRNIYLEASESSTYDGPITSDQALYYRNLYRRYRDYALLAVAAVYLVQVIDANVFSYMHNFEVSDDISMNVEPTVIMPEFQLASSGNYYQSPAMGLKLGFSF